MNALSQRKTGSVVAGKPGGTSGWVHGLGYLCSALRRDRLIAHELVLQLSTFLRSCSLFLELRAQTLRRSRGRSRSRLAADEPRHGGKHGKDGPEFSRFHSSVPRIRETVGGR